METEAARLIAAGLFSFPLMGAALGIGNIFGSYLQGAMRNPSAAREQQVMVYVGIAFAEATGLFGFVLAAVLIFT